MNKTKHGTGVAVKFALLASLVAAIFCTVAIWASYSSMSVFLRDTAGADQKKMAELMVSAIDKSIDESVAVIPDAKEVSLGDLTMDEARGTWGLPLNITGLDKPGKPADMRKSLLDIDIFYNPLKEFRIGQTGHAALVDARTYLIFSPGVKPFVNKFCSYNELQKACCEKSGWFLMDGIYGHKGKVFAAFCILDHPLLVKKGIKWWVFVVRDAKEVFEPLESLIKYEILAGIILILLLGLIGFMLGKLLVRPVRRLNDGLERLGTGDFKYRVAVDSSDELGALEASLNAAAEKLGETSTSKADLDLETGHRRKAEEKVKQLAQELQKAFDSIKASVSGGAASGNMSDFLKNADKMIDLSKVEADKIELNIKTIDIRDLIKKSVFYFEPKIREKNLDLKLDIPKGPVNIEADVERVKQVLAILLSNAVMFTDKGYVAILVRESHDDVECSVLNTGIGIAAENLAKIFDDLHNINLAIAKGIIEKHHGSIQAESEPGKITKISFKLPKKMTSRP